MPEEQKKGKGLLDDIRDLYEKDGRDAVWKFCMARPGPHGKAKRFNAAAHFARNRRDNAKTREDRIEWGNLRRIYAKERDRWEAEYEEQHPEVDWPADMRVAECMYHAPGPHFHFASPDRNKLIAVAKIGAEKFNCRIGEFPPFDSVECVHVNGSWHYRHEDGTLIPCSSSRLDKGGDAGCAFDANDWDGNNDEDYAFYIECRRRYL